MVSKERRRIGLPPARPTAQRQNRLIRGLRTLVPFVRDVPRDPVIVLGNQKSGTTAIAALLAEATGSTVTLDFPLEQRRPKLDQIRAGKLTMADFVDRNRLEFSRSIVKEPSLSVYLPELEQVFPNSRFVMVIRDPRDNIRSILNRLGLPGTGESLTDRQRDQIPSAWDLVLDGRWLGLDGVTYVEMLAQRWQFIAELYLAEAAEVVLVRYEDFLADKVGTIGWLAKEVGLEIQFDITHRVDHQFQPAGDHTVDWSDFFGPRNLAAVERICGEGMDTFGYEKSIR